ncbi:glycosyltransferase family 2 protein [Fibrella forsythiae]|uniref:Glycosyltransferase family 2 protein n=1 Tax=Fibrella forsythiae TaxID=2817061 RepID=A0ABS3JQY0_9BACT|nr:glycosyltransferase family 2 protein [Fibrella forsythiae]MBO0952415.1 glycosyltransferase family 2 protein [Fibrella forsythiae]
MDTPSDQRPTLSVALCTYNGATYLREQWASLLAQEWLPDEVVVSDDGSTDGTIALLQELSQTAPFRVTSLTNHKPLGYNGNFEKAIAACTGDLVFLCDQDDAWLPHKTRTLASYLLNNPQHDVVFGNATVADAHLTPTNRQFWDVVRFSNHDQQAWQAGEALHVLLNGNRVMGCAMAFRQSFRARALPIPANVPGGYVYDGWLALVAAATNQIGFVAEPLQLYRTHPHQQIGVLPPDAGPPVRLRDRFNRDRQLKLAPFKQQQACWQTLLSMLVARVGPQAIELPQLQHRINHVAMRAALPDARLLRLLPVMQHLLTGRYHRYADADANRLAPYVAAAGDLLE